MSTWTLKSSVAFHGPRPLLATAEGTESRNGGFLHSRTGALVLGTRLYKGALKGVIGLDRSKRAVGFRFRISDGFRVRAC